MDRRRILHREGAVDIIRMTRAGGLTEARTPLRLSTTGLLLAAFCLTVGSRALADPAAARASGAATYSTSPAVASPSGTRGDTHAAAPALAAPEGTTSGAIAAAPAAAGTASPVAAVPPATDTAAPPASDAAAPPAADTAVPPASDTAAPAAADTAAPHATEAAVPVPSGPPPAPATNVSAADVPADEGKKIAVSWTASSDDVEKTGSVVGYELLRGTSPQGPFEPTDAKVPSGVSRAVDTVPADGTDYYYTVRALTLGAQADSSPAGPVRSSPQWIKTNLNILAIFTFGFCIATLVILQLARRGTKFYIRPIGGIHAIDEAIGRATEMGKPILFVPGLQEADQLPTLAAFSILGRIAKKVADYQSRLIVPCYYAMVMVVAREVVRGAYATAGRPDAYREQDVFYVTQEQFAYVAAINGIMLRQKPAANFYLGAFFAESLVLAETGFQAGSIQIAGTDQPIQIPFFVAACDYTLIGEELYAAAAYLSEEPMQLATLKAQDLGKAAVLAILGIAALLWVAAPSLSVWFARLFEASAR